MNKKDELKAELQKAMGTIRGDDKIWSVLGSQYSRDADPCKAERALWSSVLVQAIKFYWAEEIGRESTFDYDREIRRARIWINSDAWDPEQPTFRVVCFWIQRDYRKVRRIIHEIAARGLSANTSQVGRKNIRGESVWGTAIVRSPRKVP